MKIQGKITELIAQYKGNAIVEKLLEMAEHTGDEVDLDAIESAIQSLSPSSGASGADQEGLLEKFIETFSEERDKKEEEPESNLRSSKSLQEESQFDALNIQSDALGHNGDSSNEPLQSDARLKACHIDAKQLEGDLNFDGEGAIARGDRFDLGGRGFRGRDSRDKFQFNKLIRFDDENVGASETGYVRLTRAELTDLYGPILFGTTVADSLTGDATNNVIYGDRDNDVLNGGSGDDTYLFDIGDGQDTVDNNGGWTQNNTAVFLGRNFDLNDVASWNGSTLIFDFGDGDSVTFLGQQDARRAIDLFQFEDSTMTQAELLTEINLRIASTGDSILYGSGNSHDIIYSGSGNDTLRGRGGNDTYIFEVGDGQDIIQGYSSISDNDTGIFQGRNFDVNAVSWDGFSLSFDFGGGDTVRVLNVNGRYSSLNTFQFDDRTLTLSEILTEVNINKASSGGTTLYGSSDSNDIIYSGSGNDTMIGREGNNTYVIEVGDGQDMIDLVDGYAAIGGDTVVFSGRNYDLNDVASWDGDTLVFDFGGGDTTTLIDAGYRSRAFSLQFDDQTLTNKDFLTAWLSQQSTSGNDILHGTKYADTIDGQAGDDFLYGENGTDILIGGLGADTFVLEAVGTYNGVDTVNDFNTVENDVLDISDILIGYVDGVNTVSDFARFVDTGADSYLEVDLDGAANGVNFQAVALIVGGAGLDATTLEGSGHLDMVV